MGNCQATDVAAAAVIELPDGSLHKLYWPTTAGDVMRSHPGHYVALVTFHISGETDVSTSNTTAGGAASLRLIRVRLLKHKDLLLMGQAYRLVTSQEVAKALHARKQERDMKAQAELMKQQQEQRQLQSTGVEGRGQFIVAGGGICGQWWQVTTSGKGGGLRQPAGANRGKRQFVAVGEASNFQCGKE